MTSGTQSTRQLIFAVLALAIAMISISVGAAMAKNLFPQVGTAGVATMRNGFGALMLLIFWRPWRGFRPTRRQVKLLLIYGVNLGSMNLLYYLALQRLPLGLAVAIEFIGPFGVALFHSRRLTDFVWLFLAVSGLALLLPWGGAGTGDANGVDPIGVLFALIAAGTWAIYIVFGQKAGHEMPSGTVVSFGTTIAALIAMPFGVAGAGGMLLRPEIIWSGFVVSLFSSAIPFSFDMVALKRLPARTFGILMSLEPALAAFSGFILLGEDLTLLQIAAIACIIAASFGSTASAREVVAVPPE